MLAMLFQSLIIALLAGCAAGAITAIHVAGPKKTPQKIQNENHRGER